MRGQKRGECKTCDGRIHFYPSRGPDTEPVMAGEAIVGAWAHLDEADWRLNPHQPEPK